MSFETFLVWAAAFPFFCMTVFAVTGIRVQVGSAVVVMPSRRSRRRARGRADRGV